MRRSDYFIAITSRNAGSIYSGLHVSAIWSAGREKLFEREHSAESQVALLECVCLSKRQLPVLEHSRIQLSHPRQDYAVGATRPWQNNIEGQMGKFFICSYAGQS